MHLIRAGESQLDTVVVTDLRSETEVVRQHRQFSTKRRHVVHLRLPTDAVLVIEERGRHLRKGQQRTPVVLLLLAASAAADAWMSGCAGGSTVAL